MPVTDKISSVLSEKPRNVFHVSPNACVYEALEIMADHRIGALVVLEDDKLVGLLSERDYARKIILQGKSSKETKVSEIMTSPVISVTLQDTVDVCMRLMTVNRIRHLPVVVDDKPVGVISIGDLVRHTIMAQEETIEHLKAYIASGT
jgi:CBS domain-containing protein